MTEGGSDYLQLVDGDETDLTSFKFSGKQGGGGFHGWTMDMVEIQQLKHYACQVPHISQCAEMWLDIGMD